MRKRSDRQRLAEIVSVLLRHGIRSGIFGKDAPRRVRMALEDLGPTFIKIGQILSSRPEILPPPYLEELAKLQDETKPEDFADIKATIEGELGRPLNEVFAHFDERPAACASIAVVHLAVLPSGEKVVVKVHRPHVRETMMQDLHIMRRLARLARFAPAASVLNPVEIVDELTESARVELDFRNEAENIHRFAECNRGVRFLDFPRLHPEYTTPNLLVMEYVDGVKLGQPDRLEAEGYDREDLVTKLVTNYFKQILEDGFFHADPHPANILVRGARIVYIDFGLMGTLSPGLREKLVLFLRGMATNDTATMTRAIAQIGIKRGNVDFRRLHAEIEQIYHQYSEVSLGDLRLTALLEDTYRAARENNLAMPRGFAMLMRGLVSLEGTVSRLAPGVNIMELAVPYARGLMFRQWDLRQVVEEQIESVLALSRSGLKLPVRLLEVADLMLAGRLKTQLELANLDQLAGHMSKMANRMVFGLVVSALIIGSSMLINADVGPQVLNMPALGLVGFLGAAFMGLWLLISILHSGKM